jgi:hypothetical protein
MYSQPPEQQARNMHEVAKLQSAPEKQMPGTAGSTHAQGVSTTISFFVHQGKQAHQQQVHSEEGGQETVPRHVEQRVLRAACRAGVGWQT